LTDIDSTLVQRGKTHGVFSRQAAVADTLRHTMACAHNWHGLSPEQREALTLIATKISRILNGNPQVKDHWDDIAGYATLAARSIDNHEI
tara:strand:- start:464 stop:733 length:270 start_codon:yes stop_codon:yes gene_type:complete